MADRSGRMNEPRKYLMLSRLIDWGIAKEERTLGVSMDHLRLVARATPAGS